MFTRLSGISMYYETHGRGLPLICVHGYGVDHRSLKSGMEPLFNDIDGFQRIYFDLPGMGQSETHPQILGSDDMLEMVFQFIDDRIGAARPFALAGYSYGGYLARGILSRMAERVRGVMLLCPVIRFRRSSRTLPSFRCFQRDEAFVAGLTPEEFASIDQFAVIQTREVWEAYTAHIHPSLDLADTRLMARIRDTEFSTDPDQGPSYGGPALILAGRRDVSVGYEDAWKIARRFPDGDVLVLSRAGHLLHLEQPGLFRYHVRSWLDRIRAAAPGRHS